MKTLSLFSCAAVLAGGIAAMLAWGISPPVWLTCLEAALLSGAALIYGFTAWLPTLPQWLWPRPIRGTILVVLGIGAMYVPPQLILSAYLIGIGIRLVWQSACDLAAKDAADIDITLADADRLAVPVRPARTPQTCRNGQERS
jgi:hypothetical protein